MLLSVPGLVSAGVIFASGQFRGGLSLRRVPYIGVPRALVQDRMQLFRLRDIERGGGAVVAARDFYAFQQQRGAWGRDEAA